MKFIANYKSWLDQSILDTILSTAGDRRPTNEPLEPYKLELAKTLHNAGYTNDKIGWTLYYPSHFEKPIVPPIDIGKGHLWFCKLNPGDMFPMHQDLFENSDPNLKRYWMACQDSTPGHIFVYDKEPLVGYKAGDLFEFTDSTAWHGACNIGFTPKITLQLVRA